MALQRFIVQNNDGTKSEVFFDPTIDSKLRAWAKSGDLQASNSEDVAVTDNIFQDGRVIIGANETETPFDSIYTLKVGDDALSTAHTRTYGWEVKQQEFMMLQTRRQVIDVPLIVTVYLDVVGGVDGLEPTDYLNSTLTTGNKFLTWRPLMDWVNQIQAKAVTVIVQSTTIGSPLVIDGGFGVSDKNAFSFRGDGVQYVTISTGSIQLYNTTGFISNLNILNNATIGICTVGKSSWDISNSTISLGGTINRSMFTFIGDSDCVKFNAGVVLNFGADNQNLFHCSGNGGTANVVFSNHAGGITINTYSYINLRWGVDSPTRSLTTWFVNNTDIIPSNINTSDSVIWYGTSLALKQSTYNLNSYNYPLSLGTSTPILFEDLNSSSPNLIYTTKKKIIVNEDGVVGVDDDTGGGSSIINEVEIDYGLTPVTSKEFLITDILITPIKKITISPSPNPATDRVGNDWAVDQAFFSGLAGTGEFTLYSNSQYAMVGKRKIYYTIN